MAQPRRRRQGQLATEHLREPARGRRSCCRSGHSTLTMNNKHLYWLRHQDHRRLCAAASLAIYPPVSGGIAVVDDTDLAFKPDELPADRSLILVDDDRAFILR